MFRYAFVALCSLASLAGWARGEEPAKPVTLGILRGEWKLVSITVKKTMATPLEAKVVIDDKGLKIDQGGLGTLKVTRLEPGKPLGEIDLVGDAGKYVGVYKLGGREDELYLCIALGDKRPTGLDATDDNIVLGMDTMEKEGRMAASRAYFKRLTGDWDVTSATRDGEEVSKEELKGQHVEFGGYSSAKFFKDGKETFYTFPMETDVSLKPTPMEFVSDHTAHAIFQYDGDTIDIAVSDEARPKDFKPAAKVKTYKLARRR